MSFNDRDYTREAVIKQLGLIELHCKDGSAINAGCACIETKHFYFLEGLTEEGQGFALTTKEEDFYKQLGDFSRLARKRLEVEDWDLHGVMREVMHKKHPVPQHTGNPGRYLPHGLTACERQYPSVQDKLARCIKAVEKKGQVENPVAVCRASIRCPP